MAITTSLLAAEEVLFRLDGSSFSAGEIGPRKVEAHGTFTYDDPSSPDDGGLRPLLSFTLVWRHRAGSGAAGSGAAGSGLTCDPVETCFEDPEDYALYDPLSGELHLRLHRADRVLRLEPTTGDYVEPGSSTTIVELRTGALVAHWPFDETAGSSAIDVAGLTKARLLNFPGDGSQWRRGALGGALFFDGANDYVSHPVALPVQGTIAHWLRPSSDTTTGIAFYESDFVRGDFADYDGFGSTFDLLEVHTGLSGPSDSWVASYQDGAGKAGPNLLGRYSVAEPGVVGRRWTHVAMTWDPGADLVLYVDCAEVARQSLAAAAFQLHPDRQHFLGRPSTATRFWSGGIDDVRLYDTPLSAGQVASFCAPLQAGDADGNLHFDQNDLVLAQQGGRYLAGPSATWTEGDWNGAPGGQPGSPPAGNGLFDQLDVIAALANGLYRAGPYATGTPAPLPPAVAPGGVSGDSQTTLVYDPATGELAIDAPIGSALSAIQIYSESGIFTGAPATGLGGSFDVDEDNLLFKATFGGSFADLGFGAVAPAGLTSAFLRGDLRADGALDGGGDLGTVDFLFLAPLKAGDADQNLRFDQNDLVLAQQGGKYLTGLVADWTEGDWNGAPGGQPGSPPAGSDRFDQLDLVAALNNGLYRTGPYAAGGTAPPLPPPVAPAGTSSGGVTTLVYDPATGNLSVDAPSGAALTAIQIRSLSGIFTGAPATGFGGSFDVDEDDLLFKATFGSSFTAIDLGPVALPGLTSSFLLGDLRADGALDGGGDLGTVELAVTIFANGFESGNTSAWSSSVP